jgi:hypothetical protein
MQRVDSDADAMQRLYTTESKSNVKDTESKEDDDAIDNEG